MNSSHRLFIGLCAGLALSACGGSGPEKTQAEFDTVRTVSERTRPAIAGATAKERFGRSNITAPRKAPFNWQVPEGWSELPASAMRQGNFQVDARPEVEAYLTLLPGDAGGLEANVNRWRKQMGLDPLSSSAVRSLPQVTLLGQPATWIELEGAFTGMGKATIENGKLAGSILEFPQGSVFLKMTGPKADVDAELPAFRSLIESLVIRRDDGAPEAAPQPNQGERFDPRKLQWTKPDGWEEVQASTMRLASFELDASGETECYLTILGGDGGGLQANFDRWSKQLGQGKLSAKDLAEFDRVSILGQDVPVFESSGVYAGMMGQDSGKANYGMLGTLVTMGDSSLFVKLIGPNSVVKEHKSRFFEFVASFNKGS